MAAPILELEQSADLNISSAASLELALQHLRRNNVDLLIVSLPYEAWEPESLLREISAACPGLPVVMYEPHGRISTAMRLTRMGALHYIGEPADSAKLVEIMQLAWRNSGRELPPPSDALWRRHERGEIVGTHARERTPVAADRRADGGEDHGPGHGRECYAAAVARPSSRSIAARPSSPMSTLCSFT